jgi:hypothetical protein
MVKKPPAVKKKPVRKSAERRPGNTANTSAVKLPPLPTFQRVGGAAAQKAPPQAVKGKKRGKSRELGAGSREAKKESRDQRRGARAPAAQQRDLSAPDTKIRLLLDFWKVERDLPAMQASLHAESKSYRLLVGLGNRRSYLPHWKSL